MVVMLGDRVPDSCFCSLGGYFVDGGGRIVSVMTFNIVPECAIGTFGGKVALRLAKGIETCAQASDATHILYHVTGAWRSVTEIGFSQSWDEAAWGALWSEAIQLNCCKSSSRFGCAWLYRNLKLLSLIALRFKKRILVCVFEMGITVRTAKLYKRSEGK